MLAQLMGNHAEQMQRLRVVWIAREDRLIDACSFLQAAGLMVLDGDLQGVLHSGVLSPQVSHSISVRLSAPPSSDLERGEKAEKASGLL